MNYELAFVRGRMEGELGRVADREAHIELGGEGIEKKGVAGGRGGWGGAQEGNGIVGIDLGREGER